MRIAFIAPAPLDAVSGGAVYDRAIIAGLRALGHEVDAIECGDAQDVWQRVAADARPVIDGLALPAFAPLADALAARRVVGLIHHPTALDPDHDEAARAALRVVERDLFTRLARIIVTSEATGERLTADFAVPRERIAVVVPGTADAPRSEGSGGTSCAILSIGVITPRKGHDVLLRALAKLPDLDWTLTIVGGVRDAAYAATLPPLATELGIAPRIRFAGEAVGAALETLWRQADLFALATRFEGYGMVVAEALKRGVPVAVTDGGAVGALLTPQTGVVTPVGNAAALSLALRRMIFDRALREDMREAAWQAGRSLPDWTAQARAFAAALAEGA